MKASHIFLTLAGATLIYLGYKAYAGNGLLGARNSGMTGARQIAVQLTDAERLRLMGVIIEWSNTD